MSIKRTALNTEILTASYWEHFKMAKDLALYLPIDHPKRLKIEKGLNELQQQIKV